MSTAAGTDRCVLCRPRPDNTAQWIRIASLEVTTLYLDRNQTYRGHCQLVYDGAHVAGLEQLAATDFARVALDLHRAAFAIVNACRPDHMNYVSLNNVVPHLHWHLVPRYKSDPRWGKPIYTTDPADMREKRLEEGEYLGLVAAITNSLHNTGTLA